jgi:hypothetical protein
MELEDVIESLREMESRINDLEATVDELRGEIIYLQREMENN